MYKILSLLSLVILSACSSAPSAQKSGGGTIITNADEASLLEGHHPFTFEIIRKAGREGRVNIREENGQFFLQGFHKNTWVSRTGVEEGGHAELNGKITRIGDNGFIFVGDVSTYGPFKTGSACNRRAHITFLRNGHPNYWHAQNLKNPCTGLYDDLNIYTGNVASTAAARSLANLAPAAGPSYTSKPVSTLTPLPY